MTEEKSTLSHSPNAIYIVYEYPDGTIHVKDAKTAQFVPIEELRDRLVNRRARA